MPPEPGDPDTMPPPDLDPNVKVHPALRSALRLTLSSKEYKALHEHAIQRAAASIQENVPSPARFDTIVRSKNWYNEAAIRASLRVFVGSGVLLKVVELVERRVKGVAGPKRKGPFWRSPNFRLPLALSLILFLHRFLHRFFARLRANLRTDHAAPFRSRNPRLARALTSRYAPAVGASLAGFALGIAPQAQLKLSAAIWMSTRSAEFVWNAAEEKGLLRGVRPWWFGSWLLMPVSIAQLFHAFVFDRETVPAWFSKAILNFSPSYIRPRPSTLPAQIPWPEKDSAIDSLATISKLRWPPFISPILHPQNPASLPQSVKAISPITGPAHPSISSLSCALLHPSLPSCSTAFLHHILLSAPKLAKIISTVTLALSLLSYKSFTQNPPHFLATLVKSILSLTAILSTSLGTAWASLCLFNNNTSLLPRGTLPTQRFYISGFLAGLPFALLHSRHTFTYVFRAAVDSAWKAGVKRGLWRPVHGGELFVLVTAWAVMGAVLEGRPGAVTGSGIRKGLAWARGQGFVDLVEVQEKRRRRAEQARAAAEGEEAAGEIRMVNDE